MGIFEQAKEINIMEAARLYGVDTGRISGNNVFARCPLHAEKRASFVLYLDNNSFYCFGCGAGGSVIDLACGLFGLTPYEAALKLTGDFNITIDGKSPPGKPQCRTVNTDKQLVDGFEALYDDIWGALCEYLRVLREAKKALPPFDENLKTVCADLLEVERLTTELHYGNYEARVNIIENLLKGDFIDEYAIKGIYFEGCITGAATSN
jgi:hypothetical protein